MHARNSPKKRRDPLVPCRGDVLGWLLDDRGLTVANLAKRSGELEQTIAHWLKTPGARCQRSRLRRVARALNVPTEMLSGDPYAIPMPFFFPEGFEYRYSPRTILAASRLLTEVDKAITRDLASPGIPKDLNTLAPRPVIDAAIRQVFYDLIMIGEWRKRFIRWDPKVHEARGYMEPAVLNPWNRAVRAVQADDGATRWETAAFRPERDPEHEAALLGIIRGIEHVLRPWFEGTAQLDYRALRDFVHLPAHPFAGATEQFEPTSPLAALEPNFLPPPTQQRDGGKGATNDA